MEVQVERRTVFMQCMINKAWVVREITIPLSTPKNKIESVAIAEMEKVLRDEYKHEHATYYESVVGFIGLYDVPTLRKSESNLNSEKKDL